MSSIRLLADQMNDIDDTIFTLRALDKDIPEDLDTLYNLIKIQIKNCYDKIMVDGKFGIVDDYMVIPYHHHSSDIIITWVVSDIYAITKTNEDIRFYKLESCNIYNELTLLSKLIIERKIIS